MVSILIWANGFLLASTVSLLVFFFRDRGLGSRLQALESTILGEEGVATQLIHLRKFRLREITAIRAAIDELRRVANLPPIVWQDPQ